MAPHPPDPFGLLLVAMSATIVVTPALSLLVLWHHRRAVGGPGGRLLSILIMIIGVSLFLRLLQAIFRPTKVKCECPDCGLLLHDADAVHCKHCGRVMHIRDEGVI